MTESTSPRDLSPLTVAAALSITLLALFLFCVILRMVAPGLQVSHGWIAIFTTAPVTSMQAWVEGVLFSIFFGTVGGVTFALTYNYAQRRGH